jgi:hypothetical protein
MGKEWTFFLGSRPKSPSKMAGERLCAAELWRHGGGREPFEGEAIQQSWRTASIQRESTPQRDSAPGRFARRHSTRVKRRTRNPVDHPTPRWPDLIAFPNGDSAPQPARAADADHARDAGDRSAPQIGFLFICKHLSRASTGDAEGGDNVSRLMYSQVFVVRGLT